MGNLLGSETAQILLRLTVATLVGGLLGVNRELKGKPAGMRTHALVTLGAATVALLCAWPGAGHPASDAFSRVIQGVITGIGFLGAGVILRDDTHQRVHGLTTAAGIWVAASLGLACGAGYWLPTLTAAVLTIIVLTFGGRVERWVNKSFRSDNDPSA
jgi:putative Mg2+ transporter-C (MgtC) family protein